MNLLYITDTRGRKNAVQFALKDWKQIQKDLEELERFFGHHILVGMIRFESIQCK